MSRARLVAALLVATSQAAAVAAQGTSIVMQRNSEPGDAGEVLVFVGEQLSYEPLDISCDGCLIFDSWHTARYRVVEGIHGVRPGEELEFAVAEHAILIPFGHSRFALAFVERRGDQLTLIKYQQVPVYPTRDLSFASCGPLGGGPKDLSEPLDPRGPELRDVLFSPKLVVDDTHRMSALGRKTAYDPRWHEVDGNEVVWRRGIPVADLVSALVRDDDVLKAALPELAGAAR